MREGSKRHSARFTARLAAPAALLVLLILPGALMGISACSRTARSAGEVVRTTVGDTLVVKNIPPEGPAPVAFHLEQNLVIGTLGEDADDPYALTHISDLAVDPGGRILVGSTQDAEVRIFDSGGIFVTRFGRAGQGPGEFGSSNGLMLTMSILPLEDGRIAVVDPPGEIEVFDSYGAFQEQVNLRHLDLREHSDGRVASPLAWLSATGSLVIPWTSSHIEEGRADRRLLLADSSPAPVRWLPPVREPIGFFSTPTGGVGLPFGASLYFASTGDRFVLWGASDAYTMTRHDIAADRWLRFTLVREPVPVSAGEMHDAVEAVLGRMPQRIRDRLGGVLKSAQKPDHRPFFRSLMGDDRGRVWVWRYGPSLAGLQTYDVFDSDGVWLGAVESEEGLAFVRGNHVYCRSQQDPDGFPIVIRYRLVRGPVDPDGA